MAGVRCIQAANAILGEGSCWNVAEQCLHWIDIRRPALFTYRPGEGQVAAVPLPRDVGCVAPARDGRIVLADTKGFALLDRTTGALVCLGDPEADIPTNRFNDGKVDRAGRFWAGTIDDRCDRPSGSLYRLDADRTITRIDTGFLCANGIGWSPDDRLMYFVDSMARVIWVYDFDLVSGTVAGRRPFARFADDDGVPDGLTVDAEGHVWVAIWDGWRIVRYAPDGTIDRTVAMPVQRPTSCAFGGATLETLYVTSAAGGLDAASLRRGPLAGGLFAFEPGVRGLPQPQAAVG